MPDISQILAAAFPSVLNVANAPQNQWNENALLREMERQGMIKRVPLGPTLEKTLDYRANPNGGFLASDLAAMGSTKTEILTAASYQIAQIGYPITWSKGDDARTPEVNQKVPFVASLLKNGIASHDNVLEQALFATDTSGFYGFGTHITTAGTGSDGGINSSTETWWRNQTTTYVDDTDVEAAMTTIWNACAKGSGSEMAPTLITSDGATQALFEGTQQAQQRYVDTEELKAGFKILAFKTSRYCFSQYGSTKIYFVNKMNYGVDASKQYFRDMGEVEIIPFQNGYTRQLYSALQCFTNNRSRGGVCYVA